MKYKQICPECCYEKYINEISDAVKVCPRCNGYEIASQKIVLVKESNLSEQAKKVIEFSGILSNLGYGELASQTCDSILLKYRSGDIKADFGISIESEKCPVLLGRSGVGQEYLQYDLRVSNEHCYINFSDGTWRIRDNKSTNGTFVNGIRIEPLIDVRINEGDRIKFGSALDAIELEVKINAAG